MKQEAIASGKRKSVNLSLDTGVVAAAREAGLNLSRACEAALLEAAKADRIRRFKEENREWAAAVNQWIQENELPLERFRPF